MELITYSYTSFFEMHPQPYDRLKMFVDIVDPIHEM